MSKIEINKIYKESCLETLKKTPDNFIDIVITSPPYNMNLRIRNGQYCSRQIVKELTTKYQNFADNLPIDEYFEFHKSVINELLRTSKIIFYNIQIVTGSKRAFFRIMGEFHKALKDIYIWDKKVAEPAIRDKVLNRRTELILVFDREDGISRRFRKANFNRGTLEDIWQIGREKKKNKEHGAVFPQELVHHILKNFSDEGDLVYDPFIGTGTTAYVAKLMKRNYLGSEIDKDYHNFATKRLKNSGELF